jgi:hypothetical protein
MNFFYCLDSSVYWLPWKRFNRAVAINDSVMGPRAGLEDVKNINISHYRETNLGPSLYKLSYPDSSSLIDFSTVRLAT